MCPKCGSTNVLIERHPGGKGVCESCGSIWKNGEELPPVAARPRETYEQVVEVSKLAVREAALSAFGLFRSHKTVRACKITQIEILGDGQAHVVMLWFVWGSIEVPAAWHHKHRPQPGGYLVVYEDGYTSYSPAAPFEAGYTPVQPLGTKWESASELAMALLSNGEPDKSLPPDQAGTWLTLRAEWLREYAENILPANVPPVPATQHQQAATVPATHPEALRNRYTHHAPKGDQTKRYEAIRAGCLKLALDIVAMTPGSPEQSLALNALDQVMFLANAAIARRE